MYYCVLLTDPVLRLFISIVFSTIQTHKKRSTKIHTHIAIAALCFWNQLNFRGIFNYTHLFLSSRSFYIYTTLNSLFLLLQVCKTANSRTIRNTITPQHTISMIAAFKNILPVMRQKGNFVLVTLHMIEGYHTYLESNMGWQNEQNHQLCQV